MNNSAQGSGFYNEQGDLGLAILWEGDLVVVDPLGINFTGAGVTVSYDPSSGIVNVDIPGGGGGGITGSGAQYEVTYWTSATNISGDANFTYKQGEYFIVNDTGNQQINLDWLTGISTIYADTQIFFRGTGTNQTYSNLDFTNHAITLNVGDNGSPLASTSLTLDWAGTSIQGITAGATTLLLDRGAQTYQIGDITGSGNGNYFNIDDGSSKVSVKQTGGFTTLFLDKSNGIYWMGEYDNSDNLLYIDLQQKIISLSEGSQFLLLDDNSNLTAIYSGSTGIQFSGYNQSINISLAGSSKINILNSNLQFLPFGTDPGNTYETRFYELTANGTNYVGFKAPDGIASNVMWTLPTADSTGTQALVSNGAGGLSWSSFGLGTVTSIATAGLISGGTITTTGTITTSMATNKLVGRYSAGTGIMQEITISTGLALDGSGNLTASGSSASIMTQNMVSLNVTASTTAYNAIGGPSFNTTETNRQFIIPKSGTIANLYFVTDSTQPASGSLVVTVRKNAGATTLTATVSAGAGAGTFSDTTHSFSVTAGDLLSFQWVNNATGASAGIKSVAITFV